MWTIPVATAMVQRIRNEASGVRRPSTQQSPPPNSATAARAWRAPGTGASGPIHEVAC